MGAVHHQRKRAGSDATGSFVAYEWRPDAGLVAHHRLDVIERLAGDPEARLWIDLTDASEADLQRVGTALGLHELVIEDIAERDQRAKIEYTDGTMHLVVFALDYTDEVLPVEVDIVVGERFVLTSHLGGWDPAASFDIARQGIAHYLAEGTDYLLYALLDPIVDGYFPVIDRLSDEIDTLEDEVVMVTSQPVLERLFRIRRSLLAIRHAVSPEREILNQLTNRENPLIDERRIIYFRDIYDHLIRVTDELDTHRELVSGALEAYLSTVNNGLSEVMKKLTAVTAVLAGIGAVAGIFGMSEAAAAFDFREGPGFWLVTGLVAVVGVSVFLYFRRIRWI